MTTKTIDDSMKVMAWLFCAPFFAMLDVLRPTPPVPQRKNLKPKRRKPHEKPQRVLL